MRKVMAIIAACLLFGAAVWLFARTDENRREDIFLAMGGIPVRVVLDGRDARTFAEDIAAVEKLAGALEGVFSRHRPDGELARLNRQGRGCVEDLSATLIDVMRRSRRWHDASGGAFDITVGPLIDVWKRAASAGTMPDDAAITKALARVGMGRVRLDERQICLDADDMSIDLGAIAKGAILDGMAEALRGRGVARGIVDAGGDVVAFGEGIFSIGIVHPRRNGGLMAVLAAPAGAVMTSGDYERFVTIGGRRYSHIIDPRTGMPADALVSVTVVGPNATDADALATALSVLGRVEGIALLKRLPDFGAVVVERAANGGLGLWCSTQLRHALRLDREWDGTVHTF